MKIYIIRTGNDVDWGYFVEAYADEVVALYRVDELAKEYRREYDVIEVELK